MDDLERMSRSDTDEFKEWCHQRKFGHGKFSFLFLKNEYSPNVYVSVFKVELLARDKSLTLFEFDG